MDHFGNSENRLLRYYKSCLVEEGKKLCEELDSLLQDDEFNIEKTENYCGYYLSFRKDSLDKDLLIRIQKFKYDSSNFRSIKYELNGISEARKHQKEYLKKLSTN